LLGEVQRTAPPSIDEQKEIQEKGMGAPGEETHVLGFP
jgi:hypothetical protein